MPNVCRVGDAHSCGAIAASGSPNVFFNGKAAHRIGDTDVHCGSTTQVGGSSTVFVNGIGVARIGDNHAGDPCPHPPNPQSEGSPNVYADEGA